jgi:hypothetical protein
MRVCMCIRFALVSVRPLRYFVRNASKLQVSSGVITSFAFCSLFISPAVVFLLGGGGGG